MYAAAKSRLFRVVADIYLTVGTTCFE